MAASRLACRRAPPPLASARADTRAGSRAVEPELGLAVLMPLEVELIVHVVHDDVDDHVHVKPVGLGGKAPKLLKRAQPAVQQREIVHGILVVHVLAVLE
eukprot:CAMPEP_0115235994 /NCGR_PEP_ID=MMETSP0270-20121206/35613_1 /TAXON_ID=71861 /ORGANISM="Scrippsiella trochoidea, Strain CCMP3099" /LENGTH=99 /DNA_ID=CAMNT_0002650825 /DNA_START=312 /DNA_END=609 /DNA_ORIENTATION=-